MLREIQTRWGRRNLGFAWLFAEPLVFAFPVLIMWSIMRSPFEGGIPLIPLLWSGYLPILLFRHVTGSALHVVRNNSALLYHQVVTPLDIFTARCGLEIVGNLGAIACSFAVFWLFGFMRWPVNVSLFMVGLLYMCWWSTAAGLIIAGLSERTEIVEHVWPPISYIYLPISGCFFLAEWLPTKARDAALMVMPSLHSYEMIRAGMFGNRIQAFYNFGYVSVVLGVLTLLGLWLIRDVRQYLELE